MRVSAWLKERVRVANGEKERFLVDQFIDDLMSWHFLSERIVYESYDT